MRRLAPDPNAEATSPGPVRLVTALVASARARALRRRAAGARLSCGRLMSEPFPSVPRIPASASALIFDAAGRLLILRPTYKKGWTLPGGQLEPDGESPWEACRRETREECGLQVVHARLACVDFLRPRPRRPGGVRFLFDCGVLPAEQLASVTLQPEEISSHLLAEPAHALELLSGPLRRRVAAALAAEGFVYLEDGEPVKAVR
jgi:ADP-ribose pyrophosphatase YjhB (NUDIX family)